MAFLAALTGIGLFLWALLKDWLFIFISPYKNLNILWIIIPIWLSWFFGEFFQEKKGTSFGNAITNGAVPLWVGIDWTRYLINQLIADKMGFNLILAIKFFICLAILVYGTIIIVYGIRAKSFVHLVGRIREVTYVLVMFSPFIYGIIDLSWRYLFAILIFFPIFYFLIELIDRITPTPQIYKYDKGEAKVGEEAPMPPTGAEDLGLGNLGKEEPGKSKSDDDFLKDLRI